MNGNARVAGAEPTDAPKTLGDEARKRVIARALWTEIHWLMPTDRAVAIAVDGDDIAVEFGPSKPNRHPLSTHRRQP